MSVITPTFNRRDMLIEMLDRLVEQPYRPVEAIIVDDGSTDGTAKAIEGRWKGLPGLTLKILRQENSGPARARNRGLAQAQGEFIYFLDSDDLVEPDGLTKLVAAIRASAAPYVLGRIRQADRAGRPLWRSDNILPVVDESGIVGTCWATHAALYRRQPLDLAGPFDEDLRVGEDTVQSWRIVATSGPGMVIPEVVALRRIHQEGHLSEGSPQTVVGRSTLEKLHKFHDWMQGRNGMTATMAQRAFDQLPLALLRLRATKMHDEAGRVERLARLLQRDGARPRWQYRLVRMLGSGSLVRIVGLCIPPLRGLVWRFRWLKSLLVR